MPSWSGAINTLVNVRQDNILVSMSFNVFITEHLEVGPGSGGSLGVNYFIRDEYPEGTEELDEWIIALCRISDNVDPEICDFFVVNDESEKVVARETIKDCKIVTWKK